MQAISSSTNRYFTSLKPFCSNLQLWLEFYSFCQTLIFIVSEVSGTCLKLYTCVDKDNIDRCILYTLKKTKLHVNSSFRTIQYNELSVPRSVKGESFFLTWELPATAEGRQRVLAAFCLFLVPQLRKGSLSGAFLAWSVLFSSMAKQIREYVFCIPTE